MQYILSIPVVFQGRLDGWVLRKMEDLCRSRCILLHPPLPKSQLVQDRVQANHRIRFSKVRPHFLPQLSFLLGQCVKYERQLCIMNGTPHVNLVTRRRSQFTDDIGVITFDVSFENICNLKEWRRRGGMFYKSILMRLFLQRKYSFA